MTARDFSLPINASHPRNRIAARVFPWKPAHGARTAGVAIVIVLSLIVLLTAVIVAFFSRATLERQISASSTSAAKADLLAHSALDEIVLDLKQEIAAGSTLDLPPAGSAASAPVFYLPKPADAAGISTISPAPVPALSTAPVPVNPINELKRSVFDTPFFSGAKYDTANFPSSNNASAVNSSADISPDGRYISGLRWNKPVLLDPSKFTGSDASQPSAIYNGYFAAPDWVIMTRRGPKAFAAWNDTLKNDSDPANMDFAVGRYAYMVYDESGLLDVNQAGFPSSLSSDKDFTARRGRLSQIDLTLIPGLSDPNSLINLFRNGKTAASATTYKKYALLNTPANPGFLRVIPGDQTFLSREDLLNYQSVNPGILALNSLPTLTTFTREKNAPTFTPAASRPKVQPGKTYHPDPNPAYAADPLRAISLDPGNPNTYRQDDNFNPSLLTARNSTGAPVISQRFALSRIALLSPTGPAAGASAADIKKFFGLVWDAAKENWIYTSPDGTGTTEAGVIKFLKNVPATRQPDFFEMLQAAIHVGSLGRDADGEQYYAQAYEPGISSTARIEAQNIYYHVMQIGANIIDQADTDGYPTVIRFGGETIAGIEDLPYASRVFDYIHRASDDANTVSGEYVFEVWNPHQDLANTISGPTSFRIVGFSGGAMLAVDKSSALAVDVATLPPVNFLVAATSDYRSPAQVGGTFRIGTLSAPGGYAGYIYGSPYSTFALQYQGPSGAWREYQKFRRILYQIKESFYAGSGFAEWFHQRVDPRTDRFGTSMNYLPGDTNFGASAPSGSTIRPDAGDGYFLGEDTPFNAGIFTFTGGGGSTTAAKHSTMGVVSDNTAAAAVSYLDPDGQRRPADGVNRPVGSISGQPLATANFPSRPVILNRPFRSVGELGYVFRDIPFKSLDFANANSGDLALLDAFCIDDSDVIAGRLNPNTRQLDVLSAVLNGGAKQEGTPSDGITATEARNIAQALIARTTNPTKGPLLDRTELVSKFGPEITYDTPENLQIKTQRESALRTLAESANVRTWNLLIDVIAQSGRYGSGAKKLSAFTITGERRYWLQVAIDRYTGQIVDQQLEPVNE